MVQASTLGPKEAPAWTLALSGFKLIHINTPTMPLTIARVYKRVLYQFLKPIIQESQLFFRMKPMFSIIHNSHTCADMICKISHCF